MSVPHRSPLHVSAPHITIMCQYPIGPCCMFLPHRSLLHVSAPQVAVSSQCPTGQCCMSVPHRSPLHVSAPVITVACQYPTGFYNISALYSQHFCSVEEAIVAALCYMSVMRFSSTCQCDCSVVYVSVTVQWRKLLLQHSVICR